MQVVRVLGALGEGFRGLGVQGFLSFVFKVKSLSVWWFQLLKVVGCRVVGSVFGSSFD